MANDEQKKRAGIEEDVLGRLDRLEQILHVQLGGVRRNQRLDACLEGYLREQVPLQQEIGRRELADTAAAEDLTGDPKARSRTTHTEEKLRGEDGGLLAKEATKTAAKT